MRNLCKPFQQDKSSARGDAHSDIQQSNIKHVPFELVIGDGRTEGFPHGEGERDDEVYKKAGDELSQR